jgi:arylsulfatase A-like enzyme
VQGFHAGPQVGCGRSTKALWPILIVILSLSLCLPGLAVRAAAPPNVLLIVTDDQGYGDLGFTGNPVLKTPHLDRLHEQSVRFTRFHATPLCTTTRASLFTGRHFLRTGAWSVLNGRSLLRRSEVTMAESFASGGYRTGLFGKWHLGDNFPFRPEDRGFQETITHGGGGIGTVPDHWGNDYSDDTYRKNGTAQRFPGYSTDALFKEALDFIERSRERPFFCVIATAAPHDPYNVPESYAAPYRGRVPPDTANFFGMIANLDENTGRLLARLDALGLAGNTIVIFMTDNGSSGGTKVFNAGMRGMKGSPWDGGHRVPFLIRWPDGGLGLPRDVTGLASVCDVMPTLLELCGLPAPKGVTLDGISLAPALRGAAELPAERVIITGTQPAGQPEPFKNMSVLRGPWRLVNGRELYDIANDPGQKSNIAASRPKIVAELRAAHDAFWREVEPGFKEVPRVILGDSRENPAWLNCWDLHGQSVYMQHQVTEAERADGYWEIELAAAGDYEFLLRRWPPEVDRAISDGLVVRRTGKAGQPAKEIRGANRARVTIAGVDIEAEIPPDAREVVLRARLPAGAARLQAWFINDEALGGATWGAYYVGVRKTGAGNDQPTTEDK